MKAQQINYFNNVFLTMIIMITSLLIFLLIIIFIITIYTSGMGDINYILIMFLFCFFLELLLISYLRINTGKVIETNKYLQLPIVHYISKLDNMKSGKKIKNYKLYYNKISNIIIKYNQLIITLYNGDKFYVLRINVPDSFLTRKDIRKYIIKPTNESSIYKFNLAIAKIICIFYNKK